jgi:hypothetical protein
MNPILKCRQQPAETGLQGPMNPIIRAGHLGTANILHNSSSKRP